MKSKAIIPLVLGVAVGLLAIKFLVDTVKKAKGNTQTIGVVTAKVEIGPTREITPEMLAVVQIPPQLVPKGHFTDPKVLKGRVTEGGVPEGCPVVASMLAPPGTSPGLPVRIPPGYRAMSVKVDEVTAIGYQLKPGDYVDVVATFTVKRNRANETVSRTILSNIQVAAVGQSLEVESTEKSGSRNRDKTIKAKSVTLLVSPEDAPKLHLAQTKGKICLALYGQQDGSERPIFAESVESRDFGLHDEADPDDGNGGAGKETSSGFLKGLFNSFTTPAEAPPPVVPVVEPVKPVEIKTAPPVEDRPWRVVVVNGSSEKEIFYRNDRSLSSLTRKTAPSGSGDAHRSKDTPSPEEPPEQSKEESPQPDDSPPQTMEETE